MDFTQALDRDPNVVTAYVNRGYVFHDLHQPKPAEADFESALQREPDNSEAHLGLAYASLDLRKPQVAIKQAQLASGKMGDTQPLHLILATAYGQRGMLGRSATEYRAALKFTPNDGALHLALADTLYSERKYHDALDELEIAQKLAPNNAAISALFARSYAQLDDRDQTLHYVQLAEQQAQQDPPVVSTAGSSPSNPGSNAASALIAGQRSSLSGIYLSTGEALSQIGDESGALDRFSKALTTPGSDRMSIRLAIAQIMARQDHAEDAKRQIALGLMEADTGETQPLTGEQWIGAADIFRAGARVRPVADLRVACPAGRRQPTTWCGSAWPITIWRWATRRERRVSWRRSAAKPTANLTISICWPRPTCCARSIRAPRR